MISSDHVSLKTLIDYDPSTSQRVRFVGKHLHFMVVFVTRLLMSVFWDRLEIFLYNLFNVLHPTLLFTQSKCLKHVKHFFNQFGVKVKYNKFKHNFIINFVRHTQLIIILINIIVGNYYLINLYKMFCLRYMFFHTHSCNINKCYVLTHKCSNSDYPEHVRPRCLSTDTVYCGR